MANKIYKICKDVLKITDDEIQEVKEVYEEQLNYFSPMKMATTRKQHDLGEYNKNVIEKIIELKTLIESGSQKGME